MLQVTTGVKLKKVVDSSLSSWHLLFELVFGKEPKGNIHQKSVNHHESGVVDQDSDGIVWPMRNTTWWLSGNSTGGSKVIGVLEVDYTS